VHMHCRQHRCDASFALVGPSHYFFSSLKKLLTSTEGIARRFQCPGYFLLAGFEVTINGRFWVTTEAVKEGMDGFELEHGQGRR
jgi:hypothetical protein